MIKSFILAIQFLTRLPLNIQVDFDEKTIKKSTLFFPYIGTIIALLVYVPFILLARLNYQIASVVTLFIWTAMTGGLHLDGLSDTADGFFSGRQRERVLEIMKDSRIGAFGVVAIVFDLLFKFIVINNLMIKEALIGLILGLGIARLSVVLLFTIGKSARQDGLGILFTGKKTAKYFTLSFISFSLFGLYLSGIKYVILLLIGFSTTIVIMKISYRIIDGLTGDVYGACIEVNEVLLLISWVVMQWI